MATRWFALVGLSISLAWLLGQIGIPAAFLLGPMFAGVALAQWGKTVVVPRRSFLVSQAVVGCLIARHLEPAALALLLKDWPVLVAVTLLMFAASFALGFLLMRSGAVPGTAAIWGSVPGGAAPMVILADAYGADARMVAVMAYLRVVIVVSMASPLLAVVSVGRPLSTGVEIFLQPITIEALSTTVTVVLGGLAVGLALRLPAGPMVGAIVVGAIVRWTTGVPLTIPTPLLAAAYAFIGWRIGLTFGRAALANAARSLPWLILSTLALVVFCGVLGGLLSWWLGIDPVTAYLATTPGGLDSIAIIAVSTHSDTSFVMSFQAVRFLIALSFGPRIALLLTREKKT